MREESYPIALAVADIHLSYKPPIARSAEPNWFDAMQRNLDQLKEKADELDVPILYAGDIFHTWREPAELINFAIAHLPKGYAVPGQHDLPYHRLADIERSPYWTLAKAGVLHHVYNWTNVGELKATLCGFPFGVENVHSDLPEDDLNIALVHGYCWKEGKQYPGAKDEDHAHSWFDRFPGFKTIIVGDNHLPFEELQGERQVLFNCGSFIRRNTDERNHKPRIGIIMSDGSVQSYYLDCSEDKFIDVHDQNVLRDNSTRMSGLEFFIEGLGELNSGRIDFREAVETYMHQQHISDEVQKVVLTALENQL